jgi:peptide-methionine (R)-S-oxide reductase
LNFLKKIKKNVTRHEHTEKPFTSNLLENKEIGEYLCKCCSNILFKSNHKFNSGTGWPSFFDVYKQGAIKKIEDKSLGMTRVEVVCSQCKKKKNKN